MVAQVWQSLCHGASTSNDSQAGADCLCTATWLRCERWELPVPAGHLLAELQPACHGRRVQVLTLFRIASFCAISARQIRMHSACELCKVLGASAYAVVAHDNCSTAAELTGGR